MLNPAKGQASSPLPASIAGAFAAAAYSMQHSLKHESLPNEEEDPGLLQILRDFFTRLWSPSKSDAEHLGWAYVYDEDGKFAERCNTASVKLQKVLPHEEFLSTVPRGIWHHDQSDDQQLRALVEAHSRWTGSQRARDLLDNWGAARAKFVKVFPTEYQRALGEIYERKQKEKQAAQAQATPKTEAVAAK